MPQPDVHSQANLWFTAAQHTNVSNTWWGKRAFSTVGFPPLLIILVILIQFVVYSSFSVAISPFAGFMDWAA